MFQLRQVHKLEVRPNVAKCPTEAAMIKMMRDMETTSTGDIDRDFVATMSPHHQGAIDMAKACGLITDALPGTRQDSW